MTSSDSESQYTPTVRSLDTIGMHIRSNLNEPPETFCRVSVEKLDNIAF